MKLDLTSRSFHIKECWGVFFLALFLIFLKMPDRILHGFLWAEDISIFLQEAYQQGLSSLQIPYAGYLHLIPRIVAYLQSSLLAIDKAPYFFVIVTTLLTAFCSASIFHVTKRYFTSFDDENTTPTCRLESEVLALLMALSFFLVPHQGEVFLNITNLQWVLAPTLLLLLFDIFALQENSLFFLAIKAASLFFISLTGPFSLLFSPFAALLMMSKGKKLKKLNFFLPSILFFLGALIQSIILMKHQGAPTNIMAIPWWHHIVDNLCAQLFFTKPPSDFWGGKICILLLPFLILLAIFQCNRRFLLPLALMLAALEIWGVSLLLRQPPPGITIPIGPCGYNARYYFVPAVLLAWSLILCIKFTPLRKKLLPLVLLTLLFLTGATRFRAQQHPQWEITKERDSYKLIVPCDWKTTIMVPAQQKSPSSL